MKKMVAFKMKLRPGFKAEYKRRHDQIWPDLQLILKNNNIKNYSIFFDEETDILFAVQNITGIKSSQDLSKYEVMKKWWNYMSDIMETNEDNSPVTKSLEIMFHFD